LIGTGKCDWECGDGPGGNWPDCDFVGRYSTQRAKESDTRSDKHGLQ
jgi:hypothetical protein